MSIVYSGTCVQVTDSLETALNDIMGGRVPTTIALGPGGVAIQPLGQTGNLTAGAFSVTAEDMQGNLLAYRLFITAQLHHPCEAAEQAVQDTYSQLSEALRERLSEALIVRLELILQTQRRNLATCLSSSGLDDAGFNQPATVFRSQNLLRTGSSQSQSGLMAFVLPLTNNDLQFLNGQGTSIPSVISYEDIAAMAQAAAPEGIQITKASEQGGLLRIDFSKRSTSLTGHFTASVTPSVGYDINTYIDLTLADLNLDGLTGWLAECTSEALIRGLLQDALNEGAASLNQSIASGVQQAATLLPSSLSNVQVTATLLDVELLADGVHTTPILGLMLNSTTDPCQSLRDDIRELQLELFAAKHDQDDQRVIQHLQEEIVQKQNDLNRCLAANS